MIWNKKQTVRVLAKGGILTPSYLLSILKIARLAGSSTVHFGSRQDLLFDVKKDQMQPVKEAFMSLNTDYIIHGKGGQKVQNIVSSYVSSDIMASTPWLSSGNFLFVLENFKYQPILRINITDPVQSMVPLMFGHLNFIASPIQHYWYLYIRRTEDELPVRWPVMVLSGDIGTLSEEIEQNWSKFQHGNVSDWFEIIKTQFEYSSRKIESELTIDFKYPHDYEGFGKMYSSQNYWAGFYWRNNAYEIDFLEELCHLCSNTGVSKICVTPWKSFLVKEIQEKDLILWNRLLGRFGITMRHSSFELNWHLPLQDKLAFRLRRNIVKAFDKVDVCVHGLTFGIKIKPEPSFYSIKIERMPGIKFLKGFDIFATYKISHVKNFNPNLCEYIEFASQVPRHRVAGELQSLTLKFFGQLIKTTEPNVAKVASQKMELHSVYQCKNCLSIYDARKGAPSMDIPVNTDFAMLPDDFKCYTCETPKSEFQQVYYENILKSALS